jgi:hypothetical protein
MGTMQHHQRQSRLSHNTGLLSGAGAQILGGGPFTSGSGPLGVESRISMNLEDVVLHEQKLSSILEVSYSFTLSFLKNLRNDNNASLSCEDWWDLTESSDIHGTICHKLIKDIQLRQLMIQAQKYETISVGIVQFYHLLASEQTTIDTKTSVNTYLKNLLHYIHQNFLVAAKFIQSRIMNGS